MLAIAQAMHQRDVKPRRTIAFVAFGGEELGELGSRYFVAHPPEAIALGRIVYDINLDMLGSYKSHDFVAAMGTYPKMPARAIMDRLVDRKLHVGLGGRGADSDHEPFCKLGIPYVFFWTPDAACYHATCDTVDQLDLAHYAKIAALAGALVAELAETDVDLASARQRLGCTGR
jgi:Zn-dependent M28 family amino/carboxypeptidase